jgi:hypothetical protein
MLATRKRRAHNSGMETETILTEAELTAVLQKHYRQFVRRVSFARLKNGRECVRVEFINNNLTGENHADAVMGSNPD